MYWHSYLLSKSTEKLRCHTEGTSESNSSDFHCPARCCLAFARQSRGSHAPDCGFCSLCACFCCYEAERLNSNHRRGSGVLFSWQILSDATYLTHTVKGSSAFFIHSSSIPLRRYSHCKKNAQKGCDAYCRQENNSWQGTKSVLLW